MPVNGMTTRQTAGATSLDAATPAASLSGDACVIAVLTDDGVDVTTAETGWSVVDDVDHGSIRVTLLYNPSLPASGINDVTLSFSTSTEARAATLSVRRSRLVTPVLVDDVDELSGAGAFSFDRDYPMDPNISLAAVIGAAGDIDQTADDFTDNGAQTSDADSMLRVRVANEPSDPAAYDTGGGGTEYTPDGVAVFWVIRFTRHAWFVGFIGSRS